MNIKKAYIFIFLFISFLSIYKVGAYNDACGLELLPAFSPGTSIAQEYNIKNENYLSYNGVNNQNISTILSGYSNIEYLGKNSNSVFFFTGK